ncbi:ABC transporter permease [Brevibacillus laterosporus]|uniref:Peptide ABC transporter permease n=1 Tax=Brevibacillus laterosporus TaxID=1465 RepID=A0AAP8U597_BRELA|nr:FtsX-like permease family protein [Brevibacillus laterosporus]MED1665546.1 ABC transporter permease [Brevibacillus laterosporus]MED1668496.1 ABC transporter permease [Brevibacillus laterosporus]MED1716589.1 ABC transporter permease [Brevibacillus laterosporus]PPA84905.1 peptide ABC transporter permease [Brevibacillus laterosporus]PPB02451.1 peptide ABC transporter permease [Brevibacillus laterosporus]
MKLLDSLRIVWRNLWRMKLRTVLTSVGVMIGTAAIVTMLSLSIGLKENAVKSLENFGNLTELEVYPAWLMPDGTTERTPDQMKRLDSKSIPEIKAIPGIEAVMPHKEFMGNAVLKLGRREAQHFQIIGVDPQQEAPVRSKELEKGEYLTGANNEIVISYEIPRHMRDVEKDRREARKRNANQSGNRARYEMGGSGESGIIEMVGKTAMLELRREYTIDNEPKFEKKEIRVRVVGQMQKDEKSYRGSTIYVPMKMVNELNTWMEQKREQNDYDMGMGGSKPNRSKNRNQKPALQYDSINVKVGSREAVEQVVKDLQKIGYENYSPARQLAKLNKFFFVIQLVLGGIAAISLLVATIGIVNTMIMSILERTKEIGIMKVIGATVYNIRWLFLIESGSIGLIGGLTGLGLAYGAVAIINYLGKNNDILDSVGMGMGGGMGPEEEVVTQIALVPPSLAIFAILFSVVIGLLAGILPAIRASRLSPLEAIRSQ